MATLLRNLGTFTLIALFLTACSSDPGGGDLRQSPFGAAIGAYDDGGDTLGTSLYFDFNLVEPLNEEATVTVTGPAGWNDDEPFERPVGPYPTAGHKWHWTLNGSRNIVEGVYAIEARFGGETHRVEAHVDPAEAIAAPTGLEVEASATHVSAQWDEVEGASSYLLRVMEDVEGEGYYTRGNTYTTETSAALSALELEAGTEYEVRVYAFSADFAAETVSVADEAFQASRTMTTIQP